MEKKWEDDYINVIVFPNYKNPALNRIKLLYYHKIFIEIFLCCTFILEKDLTIKIGLLISTNDFFLIAIIAKYHGI